MALFDSIRSVGGRVAGAAGRFGGLRGLLGASAAAGMAGLATFASGRPWSFAVPRAHTDLPGTMPGGEVQGAQDEDGGRLPRVARAQVTAPAAPAYDPQLAAEDIAKREQERLAAFQAEQRGLIEQEYAPIFAELDRQIGMAPEQRESFENQISDLERFQAGQVERGKQQAFTELERAREAQQERTLEGLRGLEQTIGQQRQSFLQALGPSADSSAAYMGGELLARAGTRERGNIMRFRDMVFKEIDQKRADVERVAGDQMARIDLWKSQQLADIGRWYEGRINELNMAKATASAEKARAITEIIRGTHLSFLNRLSQLDDNVNQFRQAVSTWQMQRAAEMEDWQARLRASAAYTAPTPQQYKYLNVGPGRYVAVNPYTNEVVGEITYGPASGEEAQRPKRLNQIIQEIGQILPPQ